MDRKAPARGRRTRAPKGTPLGFGNASSHAPETARSLDAYAEEVGRHSLLNREGEAQLGAQMAQGRELLQRTFQRLPHAAIAILQAGEADLHGQWLAGVVKNKKGDIDDSAARLNKALARIRRALKALVVAAENPATAIPELARLRRRLGKAMGQVSLKPQGERDLCAALIDQLDEALQDTAPDYLLASRAWFGLTPARLAVCRRGLRHGLKQVEAGRSGLAQGNLRLVIAVARRYAHMGLPLGDLIQEGNLGLLHAIDKYDYRRGFKFSTYATWWIRQAVNRGLADKGRTIRIPVHVSEQRNKLLKAQRVATQDLERLPSRDELAERSGLPVKKIKQIQEDLPATTSLSTPVGDDESTTLIDLMADQGSPTALDETFEEQRRVLAGELLNSLPDRERTVLQMRFGIGLKQPYSLRQIAGQLRMSQESARQLEIEGLRKLRESSALTVDSDSL